MDNIDPQQMSIFDVFQEMDDMQIIEKRLATLAVGSEIKTHSCTVNKTERFIEVKMDLVEEIFRSTQDALRFIHNVFYYGIQ